MSLRDFKTIKDRQNFLEKKLGHKLDAVKIYPQGLVAAQFKNCENMIGAVSVPLGVAGPIKISGKFAHGDYYIPLATTEGALVASVSRGCKAITYSGGAKVVTENIGITRGSIFKTENITESFKLKTWLAANFRLLAQMGESTSSHLKLIKLDSNIVGRNVFVRFYFDTSDAMGMNMATIATDSIARLVEEKTGNRCISLAGNFDIDKKAAWLNFILGRGRSVWAEVILDFHIVKDVLKTTPAKIHEVAITKCLIGGALSGSLGFNAHFANVIAAIYIATGQDVAHTVEGSLGITSTELFSDKLYISIYLPDLPVGTVGGGTQLSAQKEALNLLGIDGGKNGNNAAKFAEIVGGAVLAGEISLLAALAQGSLARAHVTLARRTRNT